MKTDEKMIFVAGATGLTGASVVKCLTRQYPAARIRATYHTTPPFFSHERIDYVRADLTHRQDCRNASAGCQYAVLAAATTGGAQVAKAEPARQMTDNLVMDAMMLEAMQAEGVKRVIYLSSATVYQPFDGYIREEDLDWNLDPHESYLGVGWAKRSAEKLCQFWHEKYGMEILIVRCANIYGPYAKFDPHTSNFIPALVRKAVDRMDPFEVWGDAHVVRDVIYVDDVAHVVSLLLDKRDIPFGIFNLGCGKVTTVGEVVDIVLHHAAHCPQRVMYTGHLPTTIGFRALNCDKIKQTLDWAPAHTVGEGISLTLDWWRSNKESWQR